ncbi:MAG: hypothetical protein DWQ01_20115 [Planctomycetota bacterium]|nr:MAG: hypothetical protein DWQ01_20115 [Planctomycetota bacterium]
MNALDSWMKLLVVGLGSAYAERRSHAQLRAMAEAVLRTQRRVELCWRQTADQWPAYKVFDEGMVQALGGRKQGAVICAMHLGPWWLPLLHVARLGIAGTVLATPSFVEQSAAVLDARVGELGDRLQWLPIDSRSSLRQAVSALKDGRMVAVILDSNLSWKGPATGDPGMLATEFLGMQVRLRSGAAWLAQKAGVPMIPVGAKIKAKGKIELRYGPEVEPAADSGRDSRMEAMEEVLAWLEAEVESAPEQWGGWLRLHTLWPPAAPPEVTAEAYQDAVDRFGRALQQPRRWRLSADPVKVALFQQGELHLAVDGSRQALLDVGFEGAKWLQKALANQPLPVLSAGQSQAAAESLARLELAELLVLEQQE